MNNFLESLRVVARMYAMDGERVHSILVGAKILCDECRLFVRKQPIPTGTMQSGSQN